MDATADGNDEKVNLRLPKGFLADLTEPWQEQGYNFRCEFMRKALRDAVYGTRLSKRALEDVVSDEFRNPTNFVKSLTEMRP